MAVPPALTPEEWAHRSGDIGPRVTRGHAEVYVVRADGVVNQSDLVSIAHRGVCAVGTSEVAALMALANAALPDGDPRKLTRADVRLVEDVFGEAWDDIPAYRALAAKLASLLPPEP